LRANGGIVYHNRCAERKGVGEDFGKKLAGWRERPSAGGRKGRGRGRKRGGRRRKGPQRGGSKEAGGAAKEAKRSREAAASAQDGTASRLRRKRISPSTNWKSP